LSINFFEKKTLKSQIS